MSESWFRWGTLLAPQIVILAGMWLNRAPAKDLATKLDRLDTTMTEHLLHHPKRK